MENVHPSALLLHKSSDRFKSAAFRNGLLRRLSVVEEIGGNAVRVAPETNEKGFAIPWDGEMVLTDEQPTD